MNDEELPFFDGSHQERQQHQTVEVNKFSTWYTLKIDYFPKFLLIRTFLRNNSVIKIKFARKTKNLENPSQKKNQELAPGVQ